jgi:hypothetical protein
MTKHRPDLLLWLSDARGQYIPRDFAESFADRAKSVRGVSDENWDILSDPKHEHYWDAWQDVCDNATVHDGEIMYRLYQDGDLWLVPEGMEFNEGPDGDLFIWPDDDA